MATESTFPIQPNKQCERVTNVHYRAEILHGNPVHNQQGHLGSKHKGSFYSAGLLLFFFFFKAIYTKWRRIPGAATSLFHRLKAWNKCSVRRKRMQIEESEDIQGHFESASGSVRGFVSFKANMPLIFLRNAHISTSVELDDEATFACFVFKKYGGVFRWVQSIKRSVLAWAPL